MFTKQNRTRCAHLLFDISLFVTMANDWSTEEAQCLICTTDRSGSAPFLPRCRPAQSAFVCLKHRLNPIAQCSNVLANTHLPPPNLYSHLAATRQLTGEAECTSRTERSARPVPAGPHVKWSHASNTEYIAWPLPQPFWPTIPTPKRPLFTLVGCANES